MAITYHDNEKNLSGAGQLKHVETVPSSRRLSVLPRYCEVTQDARLDQTLGLAGHAERSERSEG